MPRVYFNTSINELEQIVLERAGDPAALRQVLEELAFRHTERAIRLRAEVGALVEGRIQPPGSLEAVASEGAWIAATLPSEGHADPAAVVSLDPKGDLLEGLPSAADVTPVDAPDHSTVVDEGESFEAGVAATGAPHAGKEIPFAPARVEDVAVPLAVARARQVFRFLRDFAERNVPVRRTVREQLWSMFLGERPQHPSIYVGTVTTAAREEAPGERETEPLIRVRRPRLTQAPPPPRVHIDWVRRQSDDPFSEPELHVERTRPRRKDEVTGDPAVDALPVAERRDSTGGREAELQEWLAKWREWSESERPAREAMGVFERLYALLGRIERESERVELMLGDGRLRRMTVAGQVDHPVLLQRVELEFDPGPLEFRIVDADRPPELYGAVLQGDDGIPGERLHNLQGELEAAGFHPLGEDGTGGFLQRIAALLGPDARYLDASEDSAQGDGATLRRDPVLFLRLRSSGLPAAMARVLEDLNNGAEVPQGIKHVVGVDEPPADDGEASGGGSNGGGVASGVAQAIIDVMTAVGEPPDVLLSKPANLEQVQIARALSRHGAVLVQGPPGTGKSHTIANLVGHLVAQGDRVLVTSDTTKALRVLRQHVHSDLRSLCVTLLDQDLEGRAQLEEAVRGIVERVGSSDQVALEREVARFTETRSRAMEKAAQLHEQLRVARVAEYEPVVFGGQSIAPVEAARLVRSEGERYAWLPGPVTSGAPLPLSPEELDQLYATNGILSSEEEREFEVSLPPRDRVCTAESFARLVANLGATEPDATVRLWERSPAETEIERLANLAEVIERFSQDLKAMTKWQRAIVADGRGGEASRAVWQKLRTLVEDALAGHAASRELLLDHVVERAPGASIDEADAVAELRQHLAAGGALGRLALMFKPRWKAAIAAWRVTGQPPSRTEDFKAICAWLELCERRRALGARWERQAAPVGLPPFSALAEPPEHSLAELTAQFKGLIEWWDLRWGEVAALLGAAGFRSAAFREAEIARAAADSPFERDVALVTGPLLDVIRQRVAVARRLNAERLLREQQELLQGHTGLLAAALREALLAGDVNAWAAARRELDAVGAKAEAWQIRTGLLARLTRDARAWADAIRGRSGVHGSLRPPVDAALAWRCRQVAEELERRAAVDEREVALQLEHQRTELREITRSLIDSKAWLAQLLRTDGNARRALIGWSDTQKKIGKGTGKRVPELQAEARKLLSQAREAVPVWIMPLARVAENFDPCGRKFDVVIVDEASQSDVTGLLAFYLGKRVVVVGDHEQVSPSAVGQKLSDVQHLIAQHLVGVPNAHLYDGQTSIYDLARQAFGGNLALREHFRCVPDIVEFSNHLAYNGQMRPLRDPSTALLPHVAEYVVPNMASLGGDGKINQGEAHIVAALLAAMAEMPEYAGKSFGAITLVGEEQAFEIQKYLLSILGADRLQERRFSAGNPAQFQGDERDVVVLSMVDRPSVTGRPLSLRDTAMFKQRYNVAVSRAKDQVWLVHSLDPGRDLQPHDLRRRLIDHVRDPGAIRRAQGAALRRAESPFEAAVMQRLISAGYRIEPQVEVGRYRIDMMISDGRGRVALECDGDRFHPPEQIPEDIARQAVLERAGWRFVRLRGTRYYRDPENSMDWIFEELRRLGVSPVGAEQTPDAAGVEGGLRDAVGRRAWQIMQERGWAPQSASVGDSSSPYSLDNSTSISDV